MSKLVHASFQNFDAVSRLSFLLCLSFLRMPARRILNLNTFRRRAGIYHKRNDHSADPRIRGDDTLGGLLSEQKSPCSEDTIPQIPAWLPAESVLVLTLQAGLHGKDGAGKTKRRDECHSRVHPPDHLSNLTFLQ